MKKNNDFGEYLDKHRGSTTIQQLADIYGCTRVYMWDILKGYTNPPQDYQKVKKIAESLNLSDKQEHILFDKTALSNDIPIDIKQIILKNTALINEIRSRNEKGEL